MVALSELWLPILLSAVAVFLASFVAWMILPFHKSDFRRLPSEEQVVSAIRASKAGPGQYMFPYCESPEEMKNPEFMKKLAEGPSGMLTLRKPGPPNMGSAMAVSILYNAVVALFVAYLAGRGVPPGAPAGHVFRMVTTATLLAYAGGLFYPAIWMGRPWSTVLKDVVDSLAYAVLTGALFVFFWPAA
ncbi:MAG TPA: hypothetical protein VJV23_13770 [Candidatus Polarisedimenticolia bacterium]|nr:hypothetical protein [Candidatus Polarisedimenticolia bacterium]